MSTLKHLLALTAAFGLLSVTGCSKKDDATAGMTSEQKEANKAPEADEMPAFMQQIPAETPYVIAGLKPVPEAIVDKMFTALEPALAMMQTELKNELANLGEATTDEDKLGRAILEELDGKLNKAGLKSLGISTSPRFAIYGVGLLPVIRVELADPAALKATIGRVEQKAGVKAPVQKVGEQEYYGTSEDGMTFAVAIVGNELVVAITPATLAPTTLPIAFGAQKPGESLAAAKTLDKVIEANGYGGFGVGFVDNVAITETLLGEGRGLNATVFTEMRQIGGGIPELPAEHKAVCSAEIKGLAQKAPRFVFGTKAVTDKMWTSHFMLELGGDLAKALKDIGAPVPGLGGEPGDALFVGGFGINVDKALGFLKGRVAAAKATPYACPLLGGINETLAEMEEGLNQPLPPVVTNLRGAYVVLESVDMSGGEPKDVRGYAVIAADKPDQILAMVQGMVPPLGGVEVKADGTPVALPTAELGVPPTLGPVFAARNDKAIALSIGAGEEKKLGAALSAKSPDEPPLFSFGYDVGRFMGIMKAQSEAAMAGMPEEFRAEQAKQMEAVTGMTRIFGMVLSNVSLTDKGVVVEQRLQMK